MRINEVRERMDDIIRKLMRGYVTILEAENMIDSAITDYIEQEFVKAEDHAAVWRNIIMLKREKYRALLKATDVLRRREA